MNAFLLTYRSFMRKYDLFNSLSKALTVSDDDPASFDSTMTNVSFRICNTIKQWIGSYWYDFSEDQKLMDMLKALIEENKLKSPRVSAIISFALNQKLNNKDEGKQDIL